MTNYTECMSAIIKKEMIILGNDAVLKIARTVAGVQVNDKGAITSGASKLKLGELVSKFNETIPLSVLIAKNTIKDLVDNKEDLPDILK